MIPYKVKSLLLEQVLPRAGSHVAYFGLQDTATLLSSLSYESRNFFIFHMAKSGLLLGPWLP